MNHNPFRAPWRNGNGLSCSVFDAAGGIVATIYAVSRDEQQKRLHLVKHAPDLREALADCFSVLSRLHHGGPDEVSSHEMLSVLEFASQTLQEAEPV